jgi:DNA-binding protein H-NS
MRIGRVDALIGQLDEARHQLATTQQLLDRVIADRDDAQANVADEARAKVARIRAWREHLADSEDDRDRLLAAEILRVLTVAPEVTAATSGRPEESASELSRRAARRSRSLAGSDR